MTNENLAVISAIKSFKRENDIFKQVINNLVNEDADENLIILLLNPDLVDKIIDPDKYTEALDYLMNTYQTERSSIIRDKMLKRYEKRVQGEIIEASVSSVPTREAIESVYIKKDDIKSAENAAKTFEDNPVKVPSSQDKRDILNENNANNRIRKGADEIVSSLDPGFKEAKEASKDFADKHEEVKAKVEVPHVRVAPTKEVSLPKVEPEKESKENPKKEENIKAEKPALSTPSQAARISSELDNKMHEVKETRSVSKFFKEHKKGILIATGLAMVAVTSAIFSPIIIPSLISANATCEALAGTAAVKSLFHGLNAALAKTIGATFMNSQWLNSAGAVITSTVAKGGLLTALGTYGLWGFYGIGFGKAIKNMFKAVDLPSEKIEESIEYHPDINDETRVYDFPTQGDLKTEDLTPDNGIKVDSSNNESIYEEVKEEENNPFGKEARTEVFVGPSQEELRMNASKNGLYAEEQNGNGEHLVGQINDSSLVDELRESAPKDIIEIPEGVSPVSQEEQDFGFPSTEELSTDDYTKARLNRLLEPNTRGEEPIGVESKEINVPDDRLSKEEFEQLIIELQKSNAAKKRREELSTYPLTHGMGL